MFILFKKNKAATLFILIVLLSLSIKSQSSVCVTYKLLKANYASNQFEKKSINLKKNGKISLDGVDKNLDNIEYIMYANQYESIYFLVKKMEQDDNVGYKLASMLGGLGIYYKNSKDKVRLMQKETTGESIIVTYPYMLDDWTITKETKIIDGYLCYKATSIRKEFDSLRNRENVFYPEVWFTPEIPIPFGPKQFDGLPGLVLEATLNGKTIIYANKISFDCKDLDKNLKKPKAKTVISREKYLKKLAQFRNERQ